MPKGHFRTPQNIYVHSRSLSGLPKNFSGLSTLAHRLHAIYPQSRALSASIRSPSILPGLSDIQNYLQISPPPFQTAHLRLPKAQLGPEQFCALQSLFQQFGILVPGAEAFYPEPGLEPPWHFTRSRSCQKRGKTPEEV